MPGARIGTCHASCNHYSLFFLSLQLSLADSETAFLARQRSASSNTDRMKMEGHWVDRAYRLFTRWLSVNYSFLPLWLSMSLSSAFNYSPNQQSAENFPNIDRGLLTLFLVLFPRLQELWWRHLARTANPANHIRTCDGLGQSFPYVIRIIYRKRLNYPICIQLLQHFSPSPQIEN